MYTERAGDYDVVEQLVETRLKLYLLHANSTEISKFIHPYTYACPRHGQFYLYLPNRVLAKSLVGALQ